MGAGNAASASPTTVEGASLAISKPKRSYFVRNTVHAALLVICAGLWLLWFTDIISTGKTYTGLIAGVVTFTLTFLNFVKKGTRFLSRVLRVWMSSRPASLVLTWCSAAAIATSFVFATVQVELGDAKDRVEISYRGSKAPELVDHEGSTLKITHALFFQPWDFRLKVSGWPDSRIRLLPWSRQSFRADQPQRSVVVVYPTVALAAFVAPNPNDPDWKPTYVRVTIRRSGQPDVSRKADMPWNGGPFRIGCGSDVKLPEGPARELQDLMVNMPDAIKPQWSKPECLWAAQGCEFDIDDAKLVVSADGIPDQEMTIPPSPSSGWTLLWKLSRGK